MDNKINNLSLKLDGNNSVNAKDIANIILNLSDIIEIALYDETQQTPNIRIQSFQKGSFETLFEIIWNNSSSIMSFLKEGITIAALLFPMFIYFKDKKDIKQKTKMCEDCIYNKFPQPLNTFASCVINNNPNGGSLISTQNGELYLAPKHIKNIKENTDYILSHTTSDNHTVQTTVILLNADLKNAYIWKVDYNGKHISASMEDEDFRSKIKSGAYLMHDASINVIMDINTLIYNNQINKTNKTTYRILKVISDIIPPMEHNQVSL